MADDASNPDREAARRLYDIAMDFADRALRTQANLIREFETLAAAPMQWVGAVLVDDDDDEHLVLQADGHFAGRAMDDDTDQWERIASPDDVADHYDPVDLFTDVADAIAEMFPGLELEALKDSGMVERDWQAPPKVNDRGGSELRPQPVPDVGSDVWADAPPEHWAPERWEPPPDRWEAPAYDWTGHQEAARDAARDETGPAPPAPSPKSQPQEPAGGGSTSEAAESSGNSEQIRVLEDLMKAGVMSKEQFEVAKAKLRPR